MLIGVVENKAASGVPAAPLSAHADATARWHLQRQITEDFQEMLEARTIHR